jgi:hypothetical protein
VEFRKKEYSDPTPTTVSPTILQTEKISGFHIKKSTFAGDRAVMAYQFP